MKGRRSRPEQLPDAECVESPGRPRDRQSLLGNAAIAQMVGSTNTPGQDGGPSAGGGRSPEGVELASIQRRGPAEFVTNMYVTPEEFGDDDASVFEGVPIREHFSQPYGLRADQLSPRAPGLPAVLQSIDLGEEGTFQPDENGTFIDYHGGPGFSRPDWVDVFTAEAFHEGVSWSFRQRYSAPGQPNLCRFVVTRTISHSQGLVVTKTRE